MIFGNMIYARSRSVPLRRSNDFMVMYVTSSANPYACKGGENEDNTIFSPRGTKGQSEGSIRLARFSL